MTNIIYSAINTTTFDYAVNRERILEAMKLAHSQEQEKDARYHVLSALPLTGPCAQGFNAFVNTEQDESELLTIIRDLAKEGSPADSELTTYISFPWYHRDPTVKVDHPFYYDATNKMNNRPFYATAIIHKGTITGINLESHFEYKEGGPYDDRYFAKWKLGETATVNLGDGEITVGTNVSPLAIASNPTQARELVAYDKENNLKNIFVNGQGFYQKKAAQQLSESGRTIICATPLGSDSGDKVESGEVCIYKNGNELFRTATELNYSFKPSVTHILNTSDQNQAANTTDTSQVEKDLVKASALWMRDYLLKTKQQGFVISMSDGINSAYTLMIANRSIDLAIEACGGLEAYLDANNFGHLACKKAVMECLKEKGQLVAIKLLKSKMLTCVFMPYSLDNCKNEHDQMQALVESIGATFQVSEVGKVLTTNIAALEKGLTHTNDLEQFGQVLSYTETIQAAIERAQVTEAGIIGNMDNKICLSNTSANSVAYGRLHAGGAGQEGPISVTLSLYQTQINDNFKQLISETDGSLKGALNAVVASNSDDLIKKEHLKREAVIDSLIFLKSSPLQIVTELESNNGSKLWDTKEELYSYIDEACRLWSISQPSRVALAVAPNLGLYGKSLDRYRGVRNTRDNEYFNNGRVELKLGYLGMNDPSLIRIATSDAELRNYLLTTEFNELEIDKIDEYVAKYQEHNKLILADETNATVNEPDANAKTFAFNIGVASTHQTMFDYVRNTTNIKAAIQDGVNKNLDLLMMHELNLTGYFGDGDFDWINSEEEGNKIFAHALEIARFAEKSNMVISIGLPVFLAGYAKPFVGQALLHRGKILSISLKTTQPDGESEYEAMHFTPYDIDAMGLHQPIFIPGQEQAVCVGKPVIVIKDKNDNQVPIYLEQCAEGWPGINNDGSVNKEIQDNRRFLSNVAEVFPGLLVLNPSGSKNEVSFHKTMVRQKLGTTALEQNPNIAAYVYVNASGDDNGTVVADSDEYIVGRDEDGTLMLHHGARHTLAEHSSSSLVVAMPKNTHSYGVFVNMEDAAFNPQQLKVGTKTGAPAEFEILADDPKVREYTEITYASSAWILNSLRHHKKQCFVISLSGGADSTLGAVQIITAVDQFIKDHVGKSELDNEAAKKSAVRELFKVNFAHLDCKEDVLKAMEEHGADQAIKMIKDQILVCVYMPTANSSEDTLLSARTLIEGGPRYKLNANGHLIKPLVKEEGPDLVGLGGRFLVSDLQKPMEEFILAYSGKKEHFEELLKSKEALDALEEQRKDWPELLGVELNPEELLEQIIVLYSERKLYDKNQYNQLNTEGKPSEKVVFPPKLLNLIRQTPPTWWEKSHDLAKQNLQPRLRSICPWLLADLYDGVPLFTSNLSEAAAGYSTWAGDTSLGYENGLGGIPKSDVRRILLKYETGELCGLKAMDSLYYVNHLEPSAELRPLDKDGKYTQTDEADLMPYANLDRIIFAMILDKRTPWQTYMALKGAVDYKGKPLFKDDKERAEQIHKFCWLYSASQFKRTGGGNTPFLGNNLDPHLSQATTLFSQRLNNGRVELNLRYLAEQSGTPYDQELYNKAILNTELRTLIASGKLQDLQQVIDNWKAKQQPQKSPQTVQEEQKEKQPEPPVIIVELEKQNPPEGDKEESSGIVEPEKQNSPEGDKEEPSIKTDVPRDITYENAMSYLDDFGDAGKAIQKVLERLKPGTENSWNPYWMNSTTKVNAIIKAVMELPADASLKSVVHDADSNLYKALNIQRISPITFFGRLGWNQAKSLMAATEEIDGPKV